MSRAPIVTIHHPAQALLVADLIRAVESRTGRPAHVAQEAAGFVIYGDPAIAAGTSVVTYAAPMPPEPTAACPQCESAWVSVCACPGGPHRRCVNGHRWQDPAVAR